MPKNKKRIGILGGAFDPIHCGHLALAEHCVAAHALDVIHFVPTAQPLLKQACTAAPWQRAEMVARAIAHRPYFHLNLCELERKTPSYALLTVQSLHEAFPDSDLFWILGEDAFAELTKWHSWQELALLCDLLVVSRAHDPRTMQERPVIEACFAKAGHRVIDAKMPWVDAASRLIRADCSGLQSALPEAVRHFIIENNLYTHRSSNAG